MDIATLMQKKTSIVDTLRRGVEALVKKRKISIFKGHGKLLGNNKIGVKGESNSEEIVELELMKLSFLRQQKEFDKAFEIYNTLPKDQLLATQKYELVLLHMDNNDCDSAIDIGEKLFLIIEEDISTPMDLISEFAFNLAACFNILI